MNYKITPLEPFGVLLEPKSANTNIKDLNIESLRALFWQEQLVLLRGFDTFKNATDFSNYCGSWGEISVWPFGKVLELIEQDNPTDHIFDNSYVQSAIIEARRKNYFFKHHFSFKTRFY